MSVIEFGCAGGQGLLALESICPIITAYTGVKIQIYGFDNGVGLPEPKGYKDIPYHWNAGFFKMDMDALSQNLSNTKLIIGDVQDTVETFIQEYNPAVIGCVFHDLDFYSSTSAAMKIFEAENNYFLPRSFHYFDDIIGTEISLYSEYTGERLAINEFNLAHNHMKFDQCNHLIVKSKTYPWYHQLRILHMFNHPDYCKFISQPNQQLTI